MVPKMQSFALCVNGYTVKQLSSYGAKATLRSVVLRCVAGQWICLSFEAKATQTTVNPLYSSFLMHLVFKNQVYRKQRS